MSALHDPTRSCRPRAGWPSLWLALALAAGPIVSSCASAHAKPAPDTPPLEVPPPPSRIVAPVDTEPPQPVPLVEEPVRHQPPRQRQTPVPARPEPPKPEPPKPDAVQPPGAPAEPPKPADEAPKPPPTTLQTTPPGSEGEVERNIRVMLDHATTDLNRVDYRRLNADARTQYDTAKGFVRQAGDALKAKNLVFAQTVAKKAAELAAQLATNR